MYGQPCFLLPKLLQTQINEMKSAAAAKSAAAETAAVTADIEHDLLRYYR